MKVGKEQVAGLLAALREHAALDREAEYARQAALLADLEDALASLPGIELTRVDDEAGRPIQRLAIKLDPEAAHALARGLQDGEPAMYTRPHRLGEGLVQFDPRCLTAADLTPVVEAVRRNWRR